MQKYNCVKQASSHYQRMFQFTKNIVYQLRKYKNLIGHKIIFKLK